MKLIVERLRHTWVTLALVSLLLAIAGCAQQSPAPQSAGEGQTPQAEQAASQEEETSAQPEQYKLGFMAPLTGNAAFWGIRGQEAVELAVDQINADGGINGVPVVVEYQDTRGDKTELANVARRFVSDPQVLGIIGSVLSGDMFVAGPIADQAGVLICGFGTTARGIPEIGPYVFRIATTGELGVPAALTYAKDKFDLTSVAILYSLNNDYSVDAQALWRAAAEELDLEVTAVETYNDGDTDFSAQISKIAQTEPDALILAGYTTEGSLAAVEARKQGLEIPFIAGDGMIDTETLKKVGGSATDGMILFSGFHPEYDDSKAAGFVEEFTNRFGHEPEAAAANAYDVAQIMFEALKQAGPDRKAVRDAFASVEDFHGVAGQVGFDENGEVVKDTFILRYEDGQFYLLDLR